MSAVRLRTVSVSGVGVMVYIYRIGDGLQVRDYGGPTRTSLGHGITFYVNFVNS